MKEKLLGSDQEGLGIGLELGIRIADLKLSILAPNTVLYKFTTVYTIREPSIMEQLVSGST